MPMVTYRTAWFSSAVLFGAAGVWTSLVTSAGGALGVFCFMVLAVASVILTLTDEDGQPPWRSAFVAGCVTGASVVAVMGFVHLLGIGVTACLVLMLSVTSPMVVSRALRRATGPTDASAAASGLPPSSAGRSDPSTAAPVAAPAAAPAGRSSAVESRVLAAGWMASAPESLDEASLCLAWRKTYVALQRVTTQGTKLRIVQRRQDLLEELERRNAHGFAAWLRSGARAAGDPSRYVFPSTGLGHRENRR